MLLEMKVSGLAIDPFTNVPIVILKDMEDKNSLPVWIGVLEASAIASELEKIQFSRPMTHDLLKEVLRNTKSTVTRIEVVDLRENVYYATIHMDTGAGSFVLDARPSDAIALALRTRSPIFVDSKVLEKSRNIDMRSEKGKGEDGEKDYIETLEDLSPGDFGKYKM
ncbi:MAG TPA: bifunctional nuclease family protein [Thermodesulfobacteriota bacterium]|nr:bifunctional nuclease family protein [Thermodesulfobacteriota bacterium]